MASYPTLYVGQRWTADLATSMLPQYYIKSGPTGKTSNIVLASDTDLQGPVAADALYEAELNMVVTGATAGDIAFGFSGPASATFVWTVSTQGSTSALYTGDIAFAGAMGTTLTAGTDAALTTGTPIMIKGLVDTAATAGTFAFRWAQGTSSASATTILGGAYLKLTRCG